MVVALCPPRDRLEVDTEVEAEYEKMRQMPEVWCAFRDYEVKMSLKGLQAQAIGQWHHGRRHPAGLSERGYYKVTPNGK